MTLIFQLTVNKIEFEDQTLTWAEMFEQVIHDAHYFDLRYCLPTILFSSRTR
jgi:hypothetical protein